MCTIAFNPDGNTLASGSFDTTIKIWNLVSGVLIKKLTGHCVVVFTIAFSPDGKTLVSGSVDQSIN